MQTWSFILWPTATVCHKMEGFTAASFVQAKMNRIFKKNPKPSWTQPELQQHLTRLGKTELEWIKIRLAALRSLVKVGCGCGPGLIREGRSMLLDKRGSENIVLTRCGVTFVTWGSCLTWSHVGWERRWNQRRCKKWSGGLLMVPPFF